MNVARHIVILALKVYRWVVSPAKTALFGPLAQCRFVPSCSDYGIQAVRTHGVMRGCWLILRRLCRCHPFGSCGYDPVPEPKTRSTPSLKNAGNTCVTLNMN